MKFRNRWFGLTCAAVLLAVLVACPGGSTTPPDNTNTDTAKFDTAKFDGTAKFGQ